MPIENRIYIVLLPESDIYLTKASLLNLLFCPIFAIYLIWNCLISNNEMPLLCWLLSLYMPVSLHFFYENDFYIITIITALAFLYWLRHLKHLNCNSKMLMRGLYVFETHNVDAHKCACAKLKYKNCGKSSSRHPSVSKINSGGKISCTSTAYLVF